MLTMSILGISLGTFFVTSGYHKLFNQQRRASLKRTLHNDLPKVGLGKYEGFMMWWLPGWEFTSGLVALFTPLWVFLGLPGITQLAMLPMLAILGAALACELKERIAYYQPIDKADWLCDLLYLPETLLGIMALVVLVV